MKLLTGRRGLLIVGAADALVLARMVPGWASLGHSAGHPRAWLARDGSDGVVRAAGGAALWCLALWAAIAAGAAVLAAAPGRTGSAGRLLVHHLLPSTLRRAVATATGLSILVTPGFAAARPTAHSAAQPAPLRVAVPSPSVPRWPTDVLPPPTLPVTNASSPSTSPPTTTPPTSTPPTSTPPPEPPTGPGVVVGPGDSLWLIAARRIGPGATAREVAAQWPAWYQANQAVIGPDPNRIRPGQLLHPPAAPAPLTTGDLT
jgi:hypothetical protein